MNTTLQTRIDAKLKKDAQKTFEDLGLDLSTGIKLFLTQVVRTQSIPFELFTANNFSEAKKRALIKDAEHALKYGKRYSSAKEMHDDILKMSSSCTNKVQLNSTVNHSSVYHNTKTLIERNLTM